MFFVHDMPLLRSLSLYVICNYKHPRSYGAKDCFVPFSPAFTLSAPALRPLRLCGEFYLKHYSPP